MQLTSSGTGMVRGFPVVFKASAAEIASATHAAFDTGDSGGALAVTVAVTVVTGDTPTMTVIVEGSYDDGATWVALATVGADGYMPGSVGTAPADFTDVGTVRAIVPRPQRVRTRSVIGAVATPSFTYSVKGLVC